MSTRSLIGRLHEDGTYQARYCHYTGYPSHQVCQLADALYRYHDGDAEQMLEEIRVDWAAIAPADASTELATGDRSPLKPSHVVPHAGIGYCYTSSTPEPITGVITEENAPNYEWLYLFIGDQLRVFANYTSAGHWRSYRDYLLDDLKDIDTHEGTPDAGSGV